MLFLGDAILRRVSIGPQAVGLGSVAHQHAEQSNPHQDQDAVAKQNNAPAVRLLDLRVQYDDRRAEDRAGYRKSGGETAVTTKPSRDDHGPGNSVADAGCSQGNDHEAEKKHDDAAGEAEADEAEARDDGAPENQF